MEAKYPCVFKWMQSMNEVPSIRKYIAALDEGYLHRLRAVKN
jgi:hypothetical protein